MVKLSSSGLNLAHLRCNVVRSATEGGGGQSVHDALFAHAEVCQLTVSLCIQ